MIKDESDVQLIIDTLNSWVSELYSEDRPLINICNGKAASPELIKNVSTTYSRGVTERDIFMGCLVTFKNNPSDGKLTYHDKIKKQDVITFQFKKKRKKTKSIAADEGESFADILCRYNGKILDYEYLVRWPITKAPWMICNEEEMSRCVSKPIFRNHLRNLNPYKPQTEVVGIPIYIVDAMKIVRIR